VPLQCFNFCNTAIATTLAQSSGVGPVAHQGENIVPKLDLSSLPGLDNALGLFGSLPAENAGGSMDIIVDIMVFIYETAPPPPSAGLFF
jgi:hypothetical protein